MERWKLPGKTQDWKTQDARKEEEKALNCKHEILNEEKERKALNCKYEILNEEKRSEDGGREILDFERGVSDSELGKTRCSPNWHGRRQL